jgi:hypothetical protein
MLSSITSGAVSSLPESDQNTAIDDLHKASDALPASRGSKVQNGLDAMQIGMMADMHAMDFGPFWMG